MDKQSLFNLLLFGVGLASAKSLPAAPSSLYQNFLENTKQNFSSCTSFPLGELGDRGLAEYCEISAPAAENVNSSSWLERKENRRALLCYSLFMTVWSVCLQNASQVRAMSCIRICFLNENPDPIGTIKVEVDMKSQEEKEKKFDTGTGSDCNQIKITFQCYFATSFVTYYRYLDPDSNFSKNLDPLICIRLKGWIWIRIR
jgi:hypothetical protein